MSKTMPLTMIFAEKGRYESASSQRDRLWTICVLGFALLYVVSYTYGISRHRIFWGDELFGWALVTDPSWSHMLRAWNLGADGGGISFYVLCRLWLGILGRSELAFRAFSAAGVFAAFCIMWMVLRRYYQPLAAAGALYIVFLGSPTILNQMIQCRFYGLLLAASALVIYAMTLRSGSLSKCPSLTFVFASNLLLVSTHPLGAGFSAVLLGAYFLVDLLSRRPQWASYLAVFASWSVLLFSRTALEASAAVGKPWFWTMKPTFGDLVQYFTPSFSMLQPKLFLLLAFGLLATSKGRLAVKMRFDLLLPAAALLFCPVAIWLLSQHGTSYFVARYMIPVSLGVAVVIAEALDAIANSRFLHDGAPVVAVLLVLVILVPEGRFAFGFYPEHLRFPSSDFTGDLARQLPKNTPIVVTNTNVFQLLEYYRGRSDLPFIYPLDFPLALDRATARDVVSGENEMRNWRSAGYFSPNIRDSAEFLSRTPHFIVLEGGGVPYVEKRLADVTHWRLKRLPDFELSGFWHQRIWDVQRVGQ